MTNAEMPTSCKQSQDVQQQRLSDPAPFGVMQQSDLCGNERIELNRNDLARSIDRVTICYGDYDPSTGNYQNKDASIVGAIAA